MARQSSNRGGLASLEKDELNEELAEPGEINPLELTEEEFEEIKLKPPQPPSFPAFIFLVAVAKDLVDVATLGIAGFFFNFITWIIIRVWLLGKRSLIKKWFNKRFVLFLLAEFFPGSNWFPWWTVFVLMGHRNEKRKVEKITRAIESALLKRRLTSA